MENTQVMSALVPIVQCAVGTGPAARVMTNVMQNSDPGNMRTLGPQATVVS